MMVAFAAVAVTCLGVATGWFAIPWATNTMLVRARRRADSWWDDSLREYAKFKRDQGGVEPDCHARGREGALGIWRDDATAAALSGSLTKERLRAMGEAGFTVEGLASSGSDEDRLRCFSFKASCWERLFCAVCLGVAFCVVVFLTPNAGATTALCLCTAAMAATVVCDLRARTIPLEACAVILLAGTAFQSCMAGMDGVLYGAVVAIAVGGVALSVNSLFGVRFPAGAIGHGDVRCMGALAVATGSGALCGFAACYMLAGFAAALGCATKRMAWSDGIPMAPFLAAWLVAGAAAVLVVP